MLNASLQGVDLLFLAHSLAIGGAERQLVNLAIGLHARGYRIAVAVLRARGAFEADLRRAGVAVVDLQRSSNIWSPMILLRLIHTMRQSRPRVLYSYMSFPNVVAALLRPLSGATWIVWSVRAAFVDYRGMRLRFRVADAVERWLAFLPDLIVCNSRSGLQHARGKGYPPSRMIVIPNGIDTERFKPSSAGRERVRREWSVGANELLIGIVGRVDPMKDHATFLRAAAELTKRVPNMKFACVGGGEPKRRAEMQAMAASLGIGPRVIWSDERRDMADVYSALDVLCLTSVGEGFPNVIGEAMACDVPCAATDVGDVAWVVGDTGAVVPRGDPVKLASAVQSLVQRGYEKSESRRTRIVRNFSVDALCDSIESQVLNKARA